MNTTRDDLFPLDTFGRFDVAARSALVPPMLLAPDGRYCCDSCEALTERAALVARADGYFCGECAGETSPPVPPALAEYRHRREVMVPVLRRARRLRAGLRDVDFTERTRDFVQRVLDRTERERNAGLAPLLAARAAWQGRQLENSGAQVLRAGRNRAVVDPVVPVQRPRARWDAAIGAWVPVPASAGGAA